MKDLQSSIVQKLGYFGPEHTIACFRLNRRKRTVQTLILTSKYITTMNSAWKYLLYRACQEAGKWIDEKYREYKKKSS